MGKISQKIFFKTATPQLAKNLLGCILVRKTPQGNIAGIITETEAYTEADEAAHSFGGKKTLKNKIMFKSGGYLYVYFTYGMHYCLNIVSEKEGKGCAVLIRAVRPTKGLNLIRSNRGNREDNDLTNGPGKLCQALDITLKHNGLDLTSEQSPIYLINRKVKPSLIKSTPRVGISKAKDKPWRFIIS